MNVTLSYINHSRLLMFMSLWLHEEKTTYPWLQGGNNKLVEYDNLAKGTLEYVRDLLRADGTLANSDHLNLTNGTTDGVNHIFVGRPRDERVNPDAVPNFALPRIVIDKPGGDKDRMGGNQDGPHQSTVDMQISVWTPDTDWSTAFDVNDRIERILEEDTPTITNGSSAGNAVFVLGSSDVINDPDRLQTKMGTVRVTAAVEVPPR